MLPCHYAAHCRVAGATGLRRSVRPINDNALPAQLWKRKGGKLRVVWHVWAADCPSLRSPCTHFRPQNVHRSLVGVAFRNVGAKHDLNPNVSSSKA